MNNTVLGELINLYQYLVMQHLAAKSQEVYVQDMGFHMNPGAVVQEWVMEKIRALNDRCAYACITMEKMPITAHF